MSMVSRLAIKNTSAFPNTLFISSGNTYNDIRAYITIKKPVKRFIDRPININDGMIKVGFLVLKSWNVVIISNNNPNVKKIGFIIMSHLP